MAEPQGSNTTRPPLRRALLLMTGSSVLVPAAGVLTAPILARALGADGRGEMAAALAPSVLAVSAATLGLPEALTYFLAKHPHSTRPAVGWASAISCALGLLCLLATVGALPFLSSGDATLGGLIVLATALTIPALVVGILRGAASGRQMWGTVASERLINVAVRTFAFGGLWAVGELTVLTAVLVSCLAPIIAGVAYWNLLTRPPPSAISPSGEILGPIVSLGSRVWLGAVAGMFLGRVSQILIAPLSNVRELGLYIVATTISDVPLIVTLAVRDTLFGVNSREGDPAQITLTARFTLLVCFMGCAVLGVSLPLWIGSVFGEEFSDATLPTLMLLLSALLCVPGLMAATGLSAWGRPGLRSLGLLLTLVVNVPLLVLLVPTLGVIGACITSIVSNVVLTGFMVFTASRIMVVHVRDFLLVKRSDLTLVRRGSLNLLSWAARRYRGI